MEKKLELEKLGIKDIAENKFLLIDDDLKSIKIKKEKPKKND